MASLSPSPPPSPTSKRRRPKGWARKCERGCCSVVTHLPLVFVYGLTSWAVWVQVGIGFSPKATWTGNPQVLCYRAVDNLATLGHLAAVLTVIFYVLLNWSYTTAVFTDPGSPLNTSGSAGYSHIPTNESPSRQDIASFTVKSDGRSRFCKKCQTTKPDRAHHCSTCNRCVLKMDHHCPWLATCVGLRNYKAFLLFVIYTSIFCWLCFAMTSAWFWSEVLTEVKEGYETSIMPINYILLLVISGIIGLVLTGFTAWHISLAWRGQTTIESLEKTRYLSPLKKSLERRRYGNRSGPDQSYGQQLAEIHANTIPGVTREEEGEERFYSNGDVEQGSRAQEALRRNYDQMERDREQDRYEDYLDEQDAEKLPNAFNLGWKRNLRHLFGDKPLLWGLPVCNTSGDGWHWEPSPKWLEAREEIRHQREAQWRDHSQWGQSDGFYDQDRLPRRDQYEQNLGASNGTPRDPYSGWKGRDPRSATSVDSRMSMQTYRRRGSFSEGTEDEDAYDSSSNERSSSLPYANGGLGLVSQEVKHERCPSTQGSWQKRD